MAESEFLHALFAGLNSAGLGYCVLRNYEQLPDSAGGGDIDMAVARADCGEIARLVAQAAAASGGAIIVDYIGSGRFIRILGRSAGGWWGAAIDLFPEIAYRGAPYIDCGEVIARGRSHGIVKVACGEDEAIISLVKELVSNGKSRKGYLPEARAVFAANGPAALELLQANFRPQTIDLCAALLRDDGDRADGVGEVVSALRSDALRCGSLGSRLADLWRRSRRLLRPPGVAIAVHGTDGSGKTTLIGAVRPILEQAMHSECDYEHLRPNWIPALGRLAGKPAAGGGPVESPHAQKPSGMAGSLVRLLYYAVDYYIGYWVKIRPRLAKGAKICLFDRYCSDLVMDPARMRIALPRWLIRTVLIAVPQPDLLLCLGAEPESIYARKPETSLEEVARQVEELRGLCRRNRRAVWIDTGATVEESRDAALEAIRAAMVKPV